MFEAPLLHDKIAEQPRRSEEIYVDIEYGTDNFNLKNLHF